MVKLTLDRERCKACELCTAVCPRGILAIDEAYINQKGYHPIGLTDEESCIGCASCAKICPDSVIKVERF